MPDADPVLEAYENAGLFLGLLQSKLCFGWLTMAFHEGAVYFQWECVVRKKKRTIEREVRLCSFYLHESPLDMWAESVARSMKDSMLHSQVKQESSRV